MQYTTEMCEGKLTPTRENDPFTLALGKPYHPGRVVRVRGKRMGIEAVMGREYTKSTKRKPSSSSQQISDSQKMELKEELREELRQEYRQEFQQQFSALLKQLNIPNLELPQTQGSRQEEEASKPPSVQHEVITLLNFLNF